MNSFVYQIEKEETIDDVKLSIFSTNSNQKTKLETINIPYSIFIKEVDFKILKIESDKIKIETKYQDINNEKVIKLNIESQELKDYIFSQIKENEMITYESDIPYEHRYLIDNEIRLIDEGDYIAPKYLSLDIETIGDKDNQEIVSISTYSPSSNKVNLVYCDISKLTKDKQKTVKAHKPKDFKLKIFDNEKDLLKAFKQDIIKFEPQLLIGWNVIDFDFKIIKARMELHNIIFSLSKFEKGPSKLRIYNDFFKDSTLNCKGLLVWDLIQILKKNFISFEDYKLDTVAKEVLGDNKIDLGDTATANSGMEGKISVIENMFYNDPVKLFEYNYKDSVLTSEIMEKLNLLELMCKRSIITGTLLQKVKSPIATLDIMYLKKLHKRGYVAQTNYNFASSRPIEGAFVLDPKKGFYNDVFVFDFKSLYPTIIMTFNLDPFTYSKTGLIEAPNGAKFTKTNGILPELILKLYKERDKAKKENDIIKSHALKINMNSFYGAIASPKSRFFNQDIGEAITSFGRMLIQKTIEYVSENGNHKAVYGDTDSIFVKANKIFESLEDKKKFGKELESQINDFFSKFVKETYDVENFLDLEFEKLYSKFFIATKKRYVGYDEITKKTQFVGMEAIRGDWTELAKEFQIELVKLIFSNKSKEEIEKFILEYVAKLKNHEFDSKLEYHKKITKPLIEYTKTTPPHVRAARELENFEGRLVKYVMTNKGPKHISLLNDKIDYDYDHYIEKQLHGVSDDLLESFGIDFKSTVFKRKQTALDSFF